MMMMMKTGMEILCKSVQFKAYEIHYTNQIQFICIIQSWYVILNCVPMKDQMKIAFFKKNISFFLT